MSEKSVEFSIKKKYLVKGNLINPKAVVIVFHGYGLLVAYFSRKFSVLEKDYKIIYPEALSKFYVDFGSDKVGASWLTKIDTETEMENNIRYIDEVWQAEMLEGIPVISIAFSQGVSIASRWMAKRKIVFNQYIVWSGKFPQDIDQNAFDYMQAKDYKINFVAGSLDPFYNEERKKEEMAKLSTYFDENTLSHHSFEGGHVINKELLSELIL